MLHTNQYEFPGNQLSPQQLVRIYNAWSRWFFIIEMLQGKRRKEGVALADVQPNEKLLEVGVGVGYSLLHFMQQIGKKTVVHGIDVSPAMKIKTETRLLKSGYTNYDLRIADAQALPYDDNFFDVIFSSYVIDLHSAEVRKRMITELFRVMRSGGRAVLVHLSKRSLKRSFYDYIYRLSPILSGGCRPILLKEHLEEAGFVNVARTFHADLLPVEIIMVSKPAA